jgi:hypothetical protein
MFHTKFGSNCMPIDNVFTTCFNCGNAIEIDTDMLKEILKDGDLHSTQVACCYSDNPTIVRIK